MYILESFDKELYERDLKEEAYKEGFEVGKAIGLEVAKVIGLKSWYVTCVKNIMKNLNVSVERACEILGISMEVYSELLKTVE